VTEIHDPRLADYVRDWFAPEDDVLQGVARRAEERGLAMMEITSDVGKLLHVLVKTIEARHVLEIGTFLGYSAIWMARALAPGGRIDTLEQNPDHVREAREWIARAGFEEAVWVHEGPALETLDRLVREHAGGRPYDLAFIDAAKGEYPRYLDLSLELVRRGGLIVADNTLIAGVGAIIDEPTDESARVSIDAVRAFNERLATDPRLVSTILPIREGVSISVVTS
jgi:predicted O-methyltransferase YrrM